ncbi:MAG: peptidoglycan-binding protein [Ruminococcus sp.]|nr:peptidoglycan-binding protein [Ruminococcus sp.]
MAFSDAQKREHIRELQTYLHAISFFNDKIPRIIPDGFYSEDTALAVRAFQRDYGLPDTGETDSETWDKIVSVYKSLLHGNPIAYDIFPSASYVMRPGDKGLLVYILQAMLDDIAKAFDNMPPVAVSGEFGAETSDAVKQFQKRSGLPQNGSVDSGTWNMLVRTSEHVNKTMVK